MNIYKHNLYHICLYYINFFFFYFFIEGNLMEPWPVRGSVGLYHMRIAEDNACMTYPLKLPLLPRSYRGWPWKIEGIIFYFLVLLLSNLKHLLRKPIRRVIGGALSWLLPGNNRGAGASRPKPDALVAQDLPFCGQCGASIFWPSLPKDFRLHWGPEISEANSTVRFPDGCHTRLWWSERYGIIPSIFQGHPLYDRGNRGGFSG